MEAEEVSQLVRFGAGVVWLFAHVVFCLLVLGVCLFVCLNRGLSHNPD